MVQYVIYIFKNICLNILLFIIKNYFILKEFIYIDSSNDLYNYINNIYQYNYDNDIIFQDLCWKGYLFLAKLLYYFDDTINIHHNRESAFIYACTEGHLNVAKWLYNLDNKIDIRIDNDRAFRNICRYGNIEIAKWLYELKEKPNIHYLIDDAFHGACENNNIDIAIWLTTICKDYYIKIKNKKIIKYYVKSKKIKKPILNNGGFNKIEDIFEFDKIENINYDSYIVI